MVADAPAGEPCHGEVVALLLAESRGSKLTSVCFKRDRRHKTLTPYQHLVSAHSRPSELKKPRTEQPKDTNVQAAVVPARREVTWSPAALAALGAQHVGAALTADPLAGQHRWADHEVHRALRKILRPEWTEKFKLPVLEDIVNEPMFIEWRGFAQFHEAKSTLMAPAAKRSGYADLAVGKQRGATGSKHAVAPVVGFGMTGKQHYGRARCNVASREDPWSAPKQADPDLRYAARQTARHVQRISEHRN